jgi:lipopolysaccharide export system protein LptC
MKLFTNQLLILPNEEILRSDEKVKIVQEPNIEVDGVGLDYNKKNGIVKILKSVKVKYDK